MILCRGLAWNRLAGTAEPDGRLWFPLEFQGDGRGDNPDLYGCLYVTRHEFACVVEQPARLRGHRLSAARLRRRGGRR